MSLTKVGGDLLKQPLTIGTGVTISSDGINASGIITATSFVGDISQATGAAAGLGTALSQDQSNPLNKIYYTDTVLSIGSTQTVNPPDSSNIAYTQYAEIAVDEGFDLIVEDGDDLIPDILGLSTETAGLLSGAGGRIRADQFTNKAGTGAPSFPNGVNVTGVVTATSFSGNITGDVTGNLTGNVTGDLTGNVTSSGISSFSGELNVGAGKSIRLYGATSGYSQIIAAAGSASTTFTLPANGGSASQYLQTDGAGVLSWQSILTLGTAINVSGTETQIDFTGIPSWVKRVTVMFSAVNLSAATSLIIRLGDSGGIETTGYDSSCSSLGSGTSSNTSVVGLLLASYGTAAATFSGSITISNLSGNQWVSSGVLGRDDAAATHTSGGRKELSGTLDRIRITTINGTHTFDTGSINIMYEG